MKKNINTTMYIKKTHIYTLYCEETDKRISKTLINDVTNHLTEYATELIKDSIVLLKISGKKTLKSVILEEVMKKRGLPYNNEVIYDKMMKLSIRRLIQQYYDNCISDEYVKALINQIEYYLEEIILETERICTLRGRVTILSRDFETYLKNKEKLKRRV